MDEQSLMNAMFTLSGVAVLWRIVWYQGGEIVKLTKRQDEMWEKCFGRQVDSDNKSD